MGNGLCSHYSGRHCMTGASAVVLSCRICRRPTSPACCASPACNSCTIFGLTSGTAIGRPTMPPSCRSLPALRRFSLTAQQPLLCMAGCRQALVCAAMFNHCNHWWHPHKPPGICGHADPPVCFTACSWRVFACRTSLSSRCSVRQAASLLSTMPKSGRLLASQAACVSTAFH